MDIIADVMSKADPAKLQIATQQLENLARTKTNGQAGRKFQVTANSLAANEPTLRKVVKFLKDQSRIPGGEDGEFLSPSAKNQASKKAAMRGLETILATKMVESMMPKDQSRLYGEGTAGEIWRGFHIEAMGKALAEDGLFETMKEAEKSSEPNEKALKKTRSILPFAG